MAVRLGQRKERLGVACVTILEKKVDALIRFCLTSDIEEREQCKRELRKLLNGKAVAGTVREETTALLTEIGVSPHLAGCAYALEAICIVAEKPSAAHYGNVTALWEEVSGLFDVKPMSIERCIRHVIERCFDTCDPDMIEQYFGGTVSPDKGKLTCSEFVAGCAKIIRERMKGK